MGSIHKTR